MDKLFTVACRKLQRLLGAMAVLLPAVLALGGCASPVRLPAVPGALQYEAVVPGMPNIRYRQPQVDALLKDLRQRP